MIFELNDYEKSKLIFLSGDKTAMEGLKKVFIAEFLKDTANADVHTLAASRLSVDFLNRAFRALENLKEKEKSIKENENVV